MAGLPVFAKCCFCINLRTGCIILGVLQIIGSLIGVGWSALYISISIPTAIDQYKALNNMGGFGKLVAKEAGFVDVDTMERLLYTEVAIQLVMYIGYIIFGSMMVHGVRKSKGSLMTPWIVFSLVCLVLIIAQYIIKAIAVSALLPSQLGGTIVGLLISIYFILCVRSYREELFGHNDVMNPGEADPALRK